MHRTARQLQPHQRFLTGTLLAAAMMAGALSGCGTGPGDVSAPDSASGTGSAGSSAAASPVGPVAAPTDQTGSDTTMSSDESTTQLLLLHERLRTELGPAYSDAWVDGGVLHVAVTDQGAEATVRAAGATPVRVAFNNADLQQAKAQVQAWLAQRPVTGLEVHYLGVSGRTGSVTVKVPLDQVPALQTAANDAAPAGQIPVIVEESPGMASPLSTK